MAADNLRPTCPFGNHHVHLEITADQLQTQLAGVTWPATATLFPAGDLSLDETWRSFYSERIQLGLVSLYPRLLTTSAPFFEELAEPALPYPLIELLMVPHWSHLTDLRQGIRSRQQRLKAMLYGCCELAMLHQVVARRNRFPPPLIYAVTHQGFGDFFQLVGYRCRQLPTVLSQVYRPSITRLLQRDDIHRKQTGPVLLAYTPGDPCTLLEIRGHILAVARRVTYLLQKKQ